MSEMHRLNATIQKGMKLDWAALATDAKHVIIAVLDLLSRLLGPSK